MIFFKKENGKRKSERLPFFRLDFEINRLIIWNLSFFFVTLQRETKKIEHMEPKIGDRMKVSPQLTDQADWIDGEVIDVEHNPFMGLVISIKDKLGRIFFGQSRFFVAL